MRRYLGICLFVFTVPVIASNPGEPFDVNDWEILAPGMAIAPIGSRVTQNDCFANPDTFHTAPLECKLGRFRDTWEGVLHARDLTDAEGSFWTVSKDVVSGGECNAVGEIKDWWQIDSCDPLASCVTVARIPGHRCAEVGANPQQDISSVRSLWLDNTNGFLYIRVRLTPRLSALYDWEQVFRITGLPTLFEIMQTYEPTTNQITLRVPSMPEGFPAADWFNTYYGDLAAVGDWSQAQPLQCGYPAAVPSVGDYISVSDPLPDPAPGTGRYYVTSVNYQGQIRFGRRASGGVLSGRDPVLLPPCTN